MSSLVPCSFVRGREKTQIVIYYPTTDTQLRAVLVAIPIHPTKTCPSRSYKDVENVLPLPENGKLYYNMACIFTGQTLYLFGGTDPPPNCDYALLKEFPVKGVQRYHLQKGGTFERCNDMLFGMYRPLLAQIGDNIYALGYRKTQSHFKISFQKYDITTNKWATCSLFDTDKCETPDWCIPDNLARLPHVVIGSELHISFGNSSFTYDTEKDKWCDCKLFEAFWSKQIKKKKTSGRPSLLYFYGKEVWIGAAEAAKKRKSEPTQFSGGPPFGFSGRGIIWDANILLGVYYGDNCHLVAYLLDNVSGKVVKNQPISFNTILGMDGARIPYGAHFVEIGQGYFGLVHVLIDDEEDDFWDRKYRMELLTFKVTRIEADDDRFLEYELISNEVVIEDLPNESPGDLSSVFCVRSMGE